MLDGQEERPPLPSPFTFGAADLGDLCLASVALNQTTTYQPSRVASIESLCLQGTWTALSRPSAARKARSSARRSGRGEKQPRERYLTAIEDIREGWWQPQRVVGCDENESAVRVQRWRQRLAENTRLDWLPTRICVKISPPSAFLYRRQKLVGRHEALGSGDRRPTKNNVRRLGTVESRVARYLFLGHGARGDEWKRCLVFK